MDPQIALSLKKYEGTKLKPYVDTVGKITIGTGRNLSDKGITEDESDILLSTDIKDAQRYAQIYDWFDALDPVRQLVITSMLFNLGPTRFAGFKDFIKYMAAHDFVDASIAMLQSVWATQVGQRAIDYSKAIKQGVL